MFRLRGMNLLRFTYGYVFTRSYNVCTCVPTYPVYLSTSL